MIEAKIIFSDTTSGKNTTVTWVMRDARQVEVTPNGVTIYNEDGTFRAFYYANKVVGVEIERGEEE